VAVVDDLEGGIVAALGLDREAFVAEGREQASRAGQELWAGEG
jgi:hypothetical protein